MKKNIVTILLAVLVVMFGIAPLITPGFAENIYIIGKQIVIKQINTDDTIINLWNMEFNKH